MTAVVDLLVAGFSVADGTLLQLHRLTLGYRKGGGDNKDYQAELSESLSHCLSVLARPLCIPKGVSL